MRYSTERIVIMHSKNENAWEKKIEKFLQADEGACRRHILNENSTYL